MNYVRMHNKPCIIIYHKLNRQFGHAPTDRQPAYYTQQEIDDIMRYNVIESLANQAVGLGILSYEEILERLYEISSLVRKCFDVASKEAKWSVEDRDELMVSNSQSLRDYEVSERYEMVTDKKLEVRQSNLMRKLMNVAIEESMLLYDNCVYLGMNFFWTIF